MSQIAHAMSSVATLPPPSFRKAAKLATRARLVEAAHRLFLARGYEATTVRDIAREADRSIGAIFNCFTEKLDLLEAVTAAEAVNIRRVLRAAAAEGRDFADALHHMHAALSHPGRARIVILERHVRPARRLIQSGVVAEVIDAGRQARDRGEIVPHVSLELLGGIVLDLFVASCQTIADDDCLTADEACGMDGRISLLMDAIRMPA